MTSRPLSTHSGVVYDDWRPTGLPDPFSSFFSNQGRFYAKRLNFIPTLQKQVSDTYNTRICIYVYYAKKLFLVNWKWCAPLFNFYKFKYFLIWFLVSCLAIFMFFFRLDFPGVKYRLPLVVMLFTNMTSRQLVFGHSKLSQIIENMPNFFQIFQITRNCPNRNLLSNGFQNMPN